MTVASDLAHRLRSHLLGKRTCDDHLKQYGSFIETGSNDYENDQPPPSCLHGPVAGRNPRLKLGEIAAAADGSITAEIVTVDGSLVEKLAFSRFPNLVRQITE